MRVFLTQLAKTALAIMTLCPLITIENGNISHHRQVVCAARKRQIVPRGRIAYRVNTLHQSILIKDMRDVVICGHVVLVPRLHHDVRQVEVRWSLLVDNADRDLILKSFDLAHQTIIFLLQSFELIVQISLFLNPFDVFMSVIFKLFPKVLVRLRQRLETGVVIIVYLVVESLGNIWRCFAERGDFGSSLGTPVSHRHFAVR